MSKTCNCLLAGQKEIRFEGNLNADIVFVFESPGRTELYEGRPVVGEAGKRWEKELNNISIKRDDVFIINAARCLIDKKKLSDKQIKEVVKSCRSALRISIEHIKPKVIVACGGIASHSVMGVPITGITKRRGTWAYSTEFNCDVLYTYHPAATLHNESTLPLFQQDFRSLRAFIDNNFSPPTEVTNYREVDSIQFLLDKSNITIGIDTETQGLKWFDDDFVAISYSVSDEPKTGYNIVLWEEVLPVGDKIPVHDKYIVWHREKEEVPVFLKKANNYDSKMEELRELLTREDIKKYTKNGVGYDCHVFDSMGLPGMVNHAMDVQIASHALDSELYLNNSLAFLAQAFTDMPAWKEEFSSSYRKDDMLYSLRCDREAFNLYAIKDADATLRVGLTIKELMIKDPITANYYMKFVHPISSSVLYGISKNGIFIDRNGIQKAEVDVLEELFICEQECIKRIPEKVRDAHSTFVGDNGVLNLNRNKLIIDVLFSENGFGLTPTAFTAKSTPDNQTPQVSKDILKQIKNNSRKEVMEFIEWREDREELNNTYSDYLKPLQEYMTPKDRIHTSMSLSFTVTGRAGSRKPNTMVFPSRNKRQKKIVKSLFIAPEGYKLLNLDLSQAELRFIAHESQDERMMEVYFADDDIHKLTAQDLVARSGRVWDSLTDSERKVFRQKAKPVNFGLPYGMSPNGLREYALSDYGIKLTQKETSTMWNAWYALYPKVKDWQDECLVEMYKTGKVRTIFGRNRYLRDLHSNNKGRVRAAEREGINVKIQGPSSDYTLLGALQLYEEGIIDTGDIKLVNFVHDSLLFSLKEDTVDDYSRILKSKMEHVDTSNFGFSLSVPMKVDIQVGDDLANLKQIDF